MTCAYTQKFLCLYAKFPRLNAKSNVFHSHSSQDSLDIFTVIRHRIMLFIPNVWQSRQQFVILQSKTFIMDAAYV